MSSIHNLDLEQLRTTALACNKYCSKTMALTNSTPRDEMISCDVCLHWNQKPCSRFHHLSGGIDLEAVL